MVGSCPWGNYDWSILRIELVLPVIAPNPPMMRFPRTTAARRPRTSILHNEDGHRKRFLVRWRRRV